MRPALNRRHFIMGSLLAAGLGPSLLSQLGRAEGAGAPKTYCAIFFQPNGPGQDDYFGGGADRSAFELTEILAPLAAYQDRVVGLDMTHAAYWEVYGPRNDALPEDEDNGNSSLNNNHGRVAPHILTCAEHDNWMATTASADQVFGQMLQQRYNLPFKCEVLSPDTAIKNTDVVSYTGYRARPNAETNPVALANRLFAGAMPDEDPDLLKARRLEVMAALKADALGLRDSLPGSDQAAYAQTLANLRDLDEEVRASGALQCSAPEIPGFAGAPHPYERNFEQLTSVMAAAFACDRIRCFSMMGGELSSKKTFPHLAQPGDSWQHLGWHDMSHGGLGDRQISAEQTAVGLKRIARMTHRLVASFLDKLSGYQEPDGTTIADHTLVVIIHEHTDPGSHGRKRVPATVILPKRAGLSGGRFIRPESYSDTWGNNLFVALAHILGFDDMTTFGNPATFTRPYPGLA